jgi:recombination protein RecA
VTGAKTEKKGPPTLAAALASIQKKHHLSIGSLAAVADPVAAISTGNLAIDAITGVNGIPLGRMTELYGLPSSGKTTTALQTASILQRIIKSGGSDALGVKASDRILYLDYEHALDPTYASALGLDIADESFLFAQPGSLEEGASVARTLIETGDIRLVIFDSVAAMVSEILLEADIGACAVAMRTAALIAQLCSALNPLLYDTRCAAIFLNHLAEKISMGARPGAPPITTTPGGRALKYHASLRLEYRQVGQNKETVLDPLTRQELSQTTSTDVLIKVVKNKVAPPFRQAHARVRFGTGFDNGWTGMAILVAQKIVVAGKSGYLYFDKAPELVHPDMPLQATGSHRPYLLGERALVTFLDEHPDWTDKVVARAAEVLTISPVSLAVDDSTPLPDDESGEDL